MFRCLSRRVVPAVIILGALLGTYPHIQPCAQLIGRNDTWRHHAASGCSGTYGDTIETNTKLIGTGVCYVERLDVTGCAGSTIDSITMELFKCHQAADECEMVIYNGAADGGTGIATDRIGTTGAFFDAGTSGAFATITKTGLSATIGSGRNYIYVGVCAENSTASWKNDETTGGGGNDMYKDVAGGWPSPSTWSDTTTKTDWDMNVSITFE